MELAVNWVCVRCAVAGSNPVRWNLFVTAPNPCPCQFAAVYCQMQRDSGFRFFLFLVWLYSEVTSHTFCMGTGFLLLPLLRLSCLLNESIEFTFPFFLFLFLIRSKILQGTVQTILPDICTVQVQHTILIPPEDMWITAALAIYTCLPSPRSCMRL